jgi:hypothetical protein
LNDLKKFSDTRLIICEVLNEPSGNDFKFPPSLNEAKKSFPTVCIFSVLNEFFGNSVNAPLALNH